MPEFQRWRLSTSGSDESVLLLQGPVGIGKSMLASAFVDILKSAYPNSIVTYCFCKSGDKELSNSHSIISNLAYHCVIRSPDARAAMERLKSTNFRMQRGYGTDFFFQKLLHHSLSKIFEDVYIVLDGLEEADHTSRDTQEEQKTEIEVLLASLAKLSTDPSIRTNIRILVTSGPHLNIKRFFQNSKSRSITRGDTEADIVAYVKESMVQCPMLLEKFNRQGLSPVQYIPKRANGDFHWVVRVLQHLSKMKSQSSFLDSLLVSGNMTEFYVDILSRIGRDDQGWVSEILRWLVVARRQLSIKELRTAVEHTLNDQLDDFESFLRIECGSLINLVPINAERTDVHLVHDALVPVLLDPERCPAPFNIDEGEMNARVALVCLDTLYSSSYRPNNLYEYSSLFWDTHLSHVHSSNQQSACLVALHRFFTSDRVASWLKNGLLKHSYWMPPSEKLTAPVDTEEGVLRNTKKWLRASKENSTEGDTMKEHTQLLGWREQMIKEGRELGEYIGKAAAMLWLYDDTNSFRQTAESFALAWKYKKISLPPGSRLMRMFENSGITKFSTWAGKATGDVKPRNLGIAYAILGESHSATIEYAKAQAAHCNDPEFWEWYAHACYDQIKENTKSLLEVFKEAVALNPTLASVRIYIATWLVRRERRCV